MPLTVWAPNINLHRNVLWGRAVETPGEDPALSGAFALEFIRAMQGNVTADKWDDPGAPLLKMAATIKHYAAYDLECTSGGSDGDFLGCDAPGVDRFHFDAQIPQADLAEYYLPVFESPIKGAKPASIMCAFNSINGEPSCSSDLLMNKLARDTWAFDGFTVSDCGGVAAISTSHYMTGTPEQAVARALHGGLDAECGMNPPNGMGYYYQTYTNRAVEQKLINSSAVDLALVRKWRTALRLGLFEQSTPWDHLGLETIHSAKHVALTLSAAEQSMTLLKNLPDPSTRDTAKSTLPLRPVAAYRKIALVGPAVAATGGDMQGPYSGEANVTSIQAALFARFGASKFVVHGGMGNNDNSTTMIPAIVSAANQSDVDLVVIAAHDQYVSEGADRTTTCLPHSQAQLIQAMAALNKTVVLVVISGHTVDISFAKASPGIHAILWAYLPSEQGGPAIVNTLFGDNMPAGRLPFTLYPANITSPGQRPDPTDMSLRGGSGVTHMHYTGTPVYPFGFGLTYSSWKFEWHAPPLQQYSTNASASARLTMAVRVTNTGAVGSALVVPAYLSFTGDHTRLDISPPIRELFDFDRVFVLPSESVVVEVGLGESVLALANTAGVHAVRPGRYTVRVGGHPGGAEQAAAEASFEMAGASRTLFDYSRA